MNAAEKIDKAKWEIVRDHPFYAAILLKCEIIPDPACSTAWTDYKRIGYSPAWIDTLTEEETATVLAHEAGGHIALLHNFRREEREPRRWNRATDYAINARLKAAGFAPVEGWLYNPDYSELTEEQVYSRLAAEDEENGAGEGQGNSAEPGPGEYIGDVRSAGEAPNLDETDAAALAAAAAEIAADTAQAEALATAAGKGSAAARRAVQRSRGLVNWRAVLREWATADAASDFDFSRPDRRYLQAGLFLPSLYEPTMAPLTVIVDTSGSISTRRLSQFLAEVESIRREFGQRRMVIIDVDTKVRQVLDLAPGEGLPGDYEPQGGGGTIGAPGFHWLADNAPEIDRVIYYTDGEFCDRARDFADPDARILWALIDGAAGRSRIVDPLRATGDVLDLDSGGLL